MHLQTDWLMMWTGGMFLRKAAIVTSVGFLIAPVATCSTRQTSNTDLQEPTLNYHNCHEPPTALDRSVYRQDILEKRYSTDSTAISLPKPGNQMILTKSLFFQYIGALQLSMNLSSSTELRFQVHRFARGSLHRWHHPSMAGIGEREGSLRCQ